MTSNQIALMNARETKRHNLYTEAETARANSLNFESARRNMENQKEIAVLNNNTNLTIAQQNQANQRYIAELNAETQRQTARISADNALNVAAINADTQRYITSLQTQTQVRNTDVTTGEKEFEASLKHSEQMMSLHETQRHNETTEKVSKWQTAINGVGTLLNAGLGIARAVLPGMA